MTGRDVVIRAEGLGKKYVIGHQAERESYVALRDVIARNARTLGRSAMDLLRGRPNVSGDAVEDFWALRDVNFEITRGEVVGVIGRNGAGKSTLLKVLSRITEPTLGRVEIRGRVASLLEVGTGFHPELTGRENIYLNGAVLGMSRAEIRRKFDEIVAFAEIEKFLDTPVKRYSSGMYVRLAFAVAAHLEPEILIVDEVLAVGDAEFQKKCLGKMGEVASHGRTVLFVSHNMAAVQSLCARAIVMSQGQVALDAPVAPAVAAYLGGRKPAAIKTRRISEYVTIEGAAATPDVLSTREAVQLSFELVAERPERLLGLAVLINGLDGTRLGLLDGRECGAIPCDLTTGRTTITAMIPALPLVDGEYTIGLYVLTKTAELEFEDLADIRIARHIPKGNFAPVAPEWRGLIEISAFAPTMTVRSSSPGQRPVTVEQSGEQ